MWVQKWQLLIIVSSVRLSFTANRFGITLVNFSKSCARRTQTKRLLICRAAANFIQKIFEGCKDYSTLIPSVLGQWPPQSLKINQNFNKRAVVGTEKCLHFGVCPKLTAYGSITNRVGKLQFVEEIRATNANKMSEAQANRGRRVPASALPTWG